MKTHTYNLKQLVRVALAHQSKEPKYTLKYQEKIEKWYCKQDEGFVFTDMLDRHMHGTTPFSRKDFEEKFNCILDTEPCPKGTYKAYRKPYVECTFTGDNESFVKYFGSSDEAVRHYNRIKDDLVSGKTLYGY